MIDPFETLLKRADVPPPASASENLAREVRSGYSRRRRNRLAAAAVLVPLFGIWLAWPRPEKVPPVRQEVAIAESADDAMLRLEREERQGRAAMALLLTAERRARYAYRIEQARDDYASIVDLFPNTPWAEQARLGLAALQPRKGG